MAAYGNYALFMDLWNGIDTSARTKDQQVTERDDVFFNVLKHAWPHGPKNDPTADGAGGCPGVCGTVKAAVLPPRPLALRA
jgi:hypothetical protein